MKMRTARIVVCVLIALVFVFLLILALVANYMVNFSIGRGNPADGAVSSSLAVTGDGEQAAREKKASEMRLAMEEDGRKWAVSHVTRQPWIETPDGLHLTGFEFENSAGSDRWAFIVHGWGSASDYVLDYAKKYYEDGWSVFVPDLRAHGRSGGKWIGMGYPDRRDIIQWLGFLEGEHHGAKFVLHGFSMGAAAIMMATGEADFPESVRVCVEDAGYSSDWDELKDKLGKIYHLPSFPIMNAASLMTRLKAGYSIREADCVAPLRRSRTPTLFIHGDADDYNPFWMLDVNFSACAAPKEKLVVHGARHVMSAYVERDLYWSTVYSFIEKHF